MAWGWRLSSLLLAFSALIGPAPAFAQGAGSDGASVVVVFDNSGSMWGKLEGDKNNKLVAAREAVLNTLPKLKPGTQTGLVTFGRRRGDCGDIEVVARPESGEVERFKAPLDKLNPKGRGPILMATREAVRAIGPARPASVVLVHDDPDNCQQDACAVAAEIKRDAPGVRVHLVSIGLKREDLSRMSCLAETTGGRQFDVQTGPQLVSAINEALGLSTDGVRAPPVPVAAARPSVAAPAKTAEPPKQQGRRPTPAPAQGAPGLWLSAVLGSGGELVDGPVAWRVVQTSIGAEATVHEASGPETQAALTPGHYAVEARFGLASLRQPIEVGPDRPTPAVVTFNAGALRLMARAQTGGPIIDQVTYALFDEGSAQAGAQPLWIGLDPAGPIGLPPGSYRVRAERGLARAQRSFVVAPGATAVADLALSAGLLTLRAATREDGEALADALFVISEDDPDAPQGQREIARSAATVPDFVLPSGTYVVTLRIGGNEVRERIAVAAGESIRRTMVLALGKLVVNARADQGASTAQLRDSLTLKVSRRDGESREVARTAGGPLAVDLPTGAYRIEAQLGSQNARMVRDVEVQAGRTTQLAFELQAARLALKLTEAFSSGEPSWEVRDDAGRTVWRGSVAEPRLVLTPGRYSVRASVKDKQVERAVTLRTGDSRTLDVGPD